MHDPVIMKATIVGLATVGFIAAHCPAANAEERPLPGCSAGSCNVENTNRVLLVTDGIFQGIGAVTLIGGFLSTAHETKTVRKAGFSPTLRLAPARLGFKGYGVSASGTF